MTFRGSREERERHFTLVGDLRVEDLVVQQGRRLIVDETLFDPLMGEVNKLIGAVQREGRTLIPTRLYWNDRGLAKLQIALAKGKKAHDKREATAERDWQATVDEALAAFPRNPHILQRFHKGRTFDQPYFDPETGAVRNLHGRVRLCPYYFLIGGKAQLRGALATICPADKKLLHGMKDAILAPTAVAAI